MGKRELKRAELEREYLKAKDDRRRLQLELFRKFAVLDAIAVEGYRDAIKLADADVAYYEKRLKGRKNPPKEDDKQLEWCK